MRTNVKKTTAISLVLLASMLLVTLTLSGIVSAQAVDDATAIVLPSTGGTTNPVPGTYTYANGTSFTVTAVPDSGYVFSYWAISGNVTPGHNYQVGYNADTQQLVSVPANPLQGGIDSLIVATNPLNVICGFGYTYTYVPVFSLASGAAPTPSTTGVTPVASDAVAVILPATGGTTSPAAGTYNYADGTSFAMTATPSAGYTFNYWVISGVSTPGHNYALTYNQDTNEVTGTIPANPIQSGIDSLTVPSASLNLKCGYGFTYNYVAVFSPISAAPTTAPTTAPTQAPTAAPTVAPTATAAPANDMTTTYIIIAVVVIIIIIIVAVVAMMMRKKK